MINFATQPSSHSKFLQKLDASEPALMNLKDCLSYY